MKKLPLLLFLTSLLFFGCMSMTVEQKVERDGTSLVTYKMDVSGFVSYAQSLSSIYGSGSYGSGYSSNYDPEIEPNEEFNLENYDEYPDAEEYGLDVDVPSQHIENERGDPTAYLDITIENKNDYDVEDVKVEEVASYVFVDASFSSYSIEIDDDDTESRYVTVSVAFVDPGEYPAVYLISFEDQDGEEVIVKHVEYFEIVENDYEDEEEDESSGSGSSSLGSLENFDESMEEVCVNATRDNSDIECSYEDGILSMSKQVTPEEAKYEFTTEYSFPYIIYTLNADQLPDSGYDQDSTTSYTQSSYSGKFDDPAMKLSASYLSMMGMTIDYIIEMPGEIISAENGKIVENKAEYDILDLMQDGNTVTVQSRELDLVAVGAVGLVILAVIAIVWYFVLKKRT